MAIFRLLFTDEARFHPDLTTLTARFQVMIPGQKQGLKKELCPLGAETSPRAGTGMSNRPGSNGGGDEREGGKQCETGASHPQPALMHAVEEGGCTSKTEKKYKQCL